MKKRVVPKLRLERETLRHLSNPTLGRIHAGVSDASDCNVKCFEAPTEVVGCTGDCTLRC